MKIRIADIPDQGRELEFELDPERLSQRSNQAAKNYKKGSGLFQEYTFTKAPSVQLNIKLQGQTIFIQGRTAGIYSSDCSRCSTNIDVPFGVPIDMVLKPETEKTSADETEDLNFGFYQGIEIDCADISEELIMLSLPYRVVCEEVGEGKSCGFSYGAEEDKESVVDERFKVLRDLKLN